MAISDPVTAYNAENNLEAQMLCDYLERNGIEAHVTRDESVVGLWSFGTLPEIHKPQIWIDRSNIEAAASLLAQYELERSQRRTSREDSKDSSAAPIEVVCEECGKTTSFPASKDGTTQDCSHCGAFVDVGDEPPDFSDS